MISIEASDHISSSVQWGNSFKRISANSNGVSHLFSVSVLENPGGRVGVGLLDGF
jgi:hypothetical protein